MAEEKLVERLREKGRMWAAEMREPVEDQIESEAADRIEELEAALRRYEQVMKGTGSSSSGR